MSDDDGFYNSRTGKYVSSERAHQHVGESFGGYEKALSKKTSNFYMRPDSSSSVGIFNTYLELQMAPLVAQAMQTYVDVYTETMNSVIESLKEMTLKSEIESERRAILCKYKQALQNIVMVEQLGDLDVDSGTFSSLISSIPREQLEIFGKTRNFEELKANCNLVIRVIEHGESKLRDYKWKMEYSTGDSEKEVARDNYNRLNAIHTIRREAFKKMSGISKNEKERDAALITFWQTIDAEFAIIDEDGWKKKKYKEAHALLECEALLPAAEIFEYLGDYSDSSERLMEVSNLLEEKEKECKYLEALRKLSAGKYIEAEKAFIALGNWRDASLKAADACHHKKLWQYRKASKFRGEGEYDQAIKIYKNLAGFQDSDQLLKTTLIEKEEERVWKEREEELRKQRIYDFGKKSLDKKEYEDAQKAFASLGDYLDSPANCEIAKKRYEQQVTFDDARTLFAKGLFEQAENVITQPHMSNHRASKTMLFVIVRINELEELIADNKRREAHLLGEIETAKEEIKHLNAQRDVLVPSQKRLDEATELLQSLNERLESLGMFAFRKKEATRLSIDEAQNEAIRLRELIPGEIESQKRNVDERISPVQDKLDSCLSMLASVKKNIKADECESRTLKSSYSK